MAQINGIGVAAVGGGLLLVTSGLHGWGLVPTIQELLTGKRPSDATLQKVNAINPTPVGGSQYGGGTQGYSGSYQTGSAIAQDALRYDGGPYVSGTSGPPGTPNDCSGMVNHVLGADLGMDIPGHPNGRYSGHGPVTQQYYIWLGAMTIPTSQMQAGDLCCWPTHMGIALSPNSMISDLNPSLGVRVTSVQGGSPGSELLKVRRILAAYNASPGPAITPRAHTPSAHIGV